MTIRPPYVANLRATHNAASRCLYGSCASSCHGRVAAERIIRHFVSGSRERSGLANDHHRGTPDLGQPDWRQDRPDHPLTNQDVTDVVAYLASLRSATPGQPYPNATK